MHTFYVKTLSTLCLSLYTLILISFLLFPIDYGKVWVVFSCFALKRIMSTRTYACQVCIDVRYGVKRYIYCMILFSLLHHICIRIYGPTTTTRLQLPSSPIFPRKREPVGWLSLVLRPGGSGPPPLMLRTHPHTGSYHTSYLHKGRAGSYAYVCVAWR